MAWAVPPGRCCPSSPLPRFVLAVIIAFVSIFLANMVFAQRFRDTGDSTTAFGANLLGAMIGGILEYSSLIIGYRWLLVLVALLYGLAFLTGRRHLRIAGPTAGRTPQPAGQFGSGPPTVSAAAGGLGEPVLRPPGGHASRAQGNRLPRRTPRRGA